MGLSSICIPSWENLFPKEPYIYILSPKESYIYREKKSGRIYGHFSQDSNWSLRFKFLQLFFVQLPVGLIRISHRVVCLIKGDSFKTGYHKAKKAWQLRMQNCRINIHTKALKFPHKNKFCIVAIQHISLQIIQDVIKVVTYPLALISLQLTTVYGLINPLHGRVIYACIEDLWSRNLNAVYSNLEQEVAIPKQKVIDKTQRTWLHIHLTDYLAPCMQPKDVWISQNLYQCASKIYYEGTSRSLALRLIVHLQDKQEFFEKEGLSDLLPEIQACYQLIKTLNASDILEISSSSLNGKERYETYMIHKNNLQGTERFLRLELAHLAPFEVIGGLKSIDEILWKIERENEASSQSLLLEKQESIAQAKEEIREHLRQLQKYLKSSIECS